MQNLKLWKVLMYIVVMAMYVSSGASAFAQGNIKVSGTVLDDSGQPIIGAAVVIEGTTTGTATDFEGKYTLTAPADATLQVAFIGYSTITEAINGRTQIDFTLVDEFSELEEVQVVAYGAQKKVTVTGAISSIKSDDLVRTPISSVNNVLAGQLSGVTTVQYSGEPGENSTNIFVRGKATFAGDDAVKPLIQIDGVEREMHDIDPNEIESITVLKDASATAVFGVRGANGVILITTKRGKEGKASIDVSTSFSALMPTKMVEMASSLQYAEFYNKQLANDGQAPLFSESVIDKFRKNSDPIRFPSIDWADYIMKDVSLQTQSNLSISGGTEDVKYFVSAGMFTQGGVFKEFDLPYHLDYRYQRFNYRSNIDIDVTKSTKVSLNVAGKADRTHKPQTGQGSSGMIKNIYYATPFSSPGFVDGVFVTLSNAAGDNTFQDSEGNDYQEMLPFIGGHGMAFYMSGGRYRQDNIKISMDLIFDQKLDVLTEGLSFKVKGSYNSSYWVQNVASGGSVATVTPVISNNEIKYRKNAEDCVPTSFKNSTGKGRDWYFEASLSYNRTFGSHTVTALALYNQDKVYYPKTYSDIANTHIGFAGRVTYDWSNKYMADLNIGYNGSENFSKENRFGTFPSGSVGWAVSQEPFFEVVKPWVSFLKLRASWGLVGNDKVGGNRFMYTDNPFSVNNYSSADHDIDGKNSSTVGGPAYYYDVSDTYDTEKAITPGAVEYEVHNKGVTWEKAFKQDYGFDLNFLDDKITTNFDYYKEHRKDILYQDNTVPKLMGFSTYPYSNFGEVDSWGWEATVGYNQVITDELRVWAKLNISYNQNEIKVDRQAPQENEYMYTAGRRIGARNQYKFYGFYTDETANRYCKEYGVSQIPTQTLVDNLKYGDAIFVDIDGNGVVDANDMTRTLGYTDDPEYIAGLNLGASWKGFTVSMQFTSAWHVSRMIQDVFRRPFTSAAGTTDGGLLVYHVDNTWNAENPNGDYEYPRATFNNGAQNYADCTLYEKDAKYLRLKTAELSYDFNFPFMKTIGLRKLNLSVNGYNLFTVSPYIWGDPEARATNAPSYPLQRTYTASLKLGF